MTQGINEAVNLTVINNKAIAGLAGNIRHLTWALAATVLYAIAATTYSIVLDDRINKLEARLEILESVAPEAVRASNYMRLLEGYGK